MLIVVYIITAGVSIIIGIWLAYYARFSSQAKSRYEAKKARIETPTPVIPQDNGSLKESIYEELIDAVDSSKDRQKVSQKISQIVDRELQKKLDVQAQEVARKYDSIIKEKGQHEEIAWKKYEKVLVDKRQTEAVIRSIAEGLLVVDSEGKVVMMNPAAEKLLGASKKSQLGKPVEDNLKDEQLVSLTKGFPGKEKNKEIELLSKDDETKKILRASSAVIEDENGQTVGMVSVLSDITKQKELDQLKANFIANVSHEIRSPLAATEKAISLILTKSAGALTENQEQFLSIADRNLKRLARIINDLLDLSKLEARKMDLKRSPASIEALISEAVEGMRVWADTKSITLQKSVKSGLPEINIDENKIIQVFNNLIGNAIKFTPSGGKITVAAVLKDGDKTLEVSVADTGIGIDPENLHRVFDKFYQTGERVATDVSGTGIGLSIVKEIVELHGGKIWVESEKGHGTRFVFILPL